MNDFYNMDGISNILKLFKVNTAIISGITDKDLVNSILKYDALFTNINTNTPNSISGNPLNVLQKLENYDAIFIDDDANWYTVINELKIIKETNDEFPLVFICNNNFPNKRRDSYLNPDNIPPNFRQKYSKELPIYYNNEKIIICDGFYHACEENTSKNGVLTAIEDFLNENMHIGIIKINFIKEICIVYPKSQINQKRISIIKKNIQSEKIHDINISDKLIENQLLISYINKYEVYNENFIDLETEISRKNSIINDYENKIRHQTNEMNFKDSKISGFESNLNLKDSQIKNIESKLVNKNRKINNLEDQLKTANSDLNSMTQEVDNRNIKINNLEDQLKTANSDLNSMTQEVDNRNIKINNLEDQLKTANSDFDFLTQKINDAADEFTQQKLDYNNKINSLNEEINTNAMNFKNNETELTNKIKFKDSEIYDLKNELNEKEKDLIKTKAELNHQITLNNEIKNEEKKKLSSIEHSYMKNLSKLDNKEYCISCFKEEISNNQLEIEYLKNKTVTKKILSPIAYFYLIIKSNPKDIALNIKLYRTLKNSKCFDIGFYLNNNKDLIKSKWCKYFSPELHYICNGFIENRTFNKKYFNRNSKKELLEYLLNCDE